jgi:hypothetical protein
MPGCQARGPPVARRNLRTRPRPRRPLRRQASCPGTRRLSPRPRRHSWSPARRRNGGEGADLIYAFVNDRLCRGGEREFVRVEALREEFNDWLTPPHQSEIRR